MKKLLSIHFLHICAFPILLLFIVSLPARAQQRMVQYIVQGRVVNENNGELIEMAAVRLFTYSGNDSTLVHGVQTDLNGAFFMKAPTGNYAVIISSVGYVQKKVAVKVAGADVNLKSIKLREDVQVLGEVQVRGTAAEMVVRGDTLEYNAAAYKTQENAMVEDLLKKMSGVEVSSDGTVKVNGEEVKGIRIDGKKFFGDDVQMATKNIPAEMIDKIQVIDEKSDMAKLTGFEDDDTERIINLKLKENRKKGLFGNFNGALGADALGDDQTKLFHYNYRGTAADKAGQFFREDFRYNANAFMNLMLGESQTTVIAGANNVNEFRSGRGRNWRAGNNSGITWTENLGVNTNIAAGDKVIFGGDASLNHSYNYTATQAEKEQYLTSDEGNLTYINNDSTAKTSKSWDASLRLEIEYNIDTLNKLVFQPRISYTNTWYNQQNDYLYLRKDSVLGVADSMSYGAQKNVSLAAETGAQLRVIYNHKFLKQGRTLTINAFSQLTNTDQTGDNVATGTKTLDQRQLKKSNVVNSNVRVSYVEPIYGKNHFLETVLSFRHTLTSSDKRQYSPLLDVLGDYVLQGAEPQYTVIDSAYSNTFSNNFFSETLELNYRFVNKDLDVSAGMRVNPSQTISRTRYFNGEEANIFRNVWNWAPQATVKYKLAKKKFVRLRYRGRSVQPSVSQMEPVRDNSNAMSESVGNLNLTPAFQHSLHFMFSTFNQETMGSMFGGVHANLTKDALVSNAVYDETGKVYRQTVNAAGLPFDVSADFMLNTPVVKNLLHFNTRTALSFNQRLAYILREQKAAVIEALLADNTPLMLGDESRTGNFRANEELGLRLTHDVLDFGVRGNITYSRTKNSLSAANINNTIDWGVTADFVFHLPYNWSISTDIGYNDKWGYNLQGSLSEILWNASVSKTWSSATLALEMKDILNQRKNVVETIGDNYVQYQRFNTLPTYFMLSFTYKINKMGGLKAKGRGAFMQEMIEQGNKLPQGPPPFMR
ncbi:MAG: outer membrane beta-barrel protein [Paludibacteraceae bacterium]|nr:outer membrane beta-barrel protein [Paludibacteraceae bacterium]